ncbi:MAG TPA: hypothetical protein VF463_20690 [Sphingobium sp.]
MGALRKEAAVKPNSPARLVVRDADVSAEDLFRRTMKRYPKTMARLAE